MSVRLAAVVIATCSMACIANAEPPLPNEPFTEDADGDGVAERGRIVTPEYTLEWVPLEEWGFDSGLRANMLVYDSMNSGFGAAQFSTTTLIDDFEVDQARGALLDLITLRWAGGVSIPNSIIRFVWVDPLFGPQDPLSITFPQAGGFGWTIQMPPQGFDFRDRGWLQLEAAAAHQNPTGIATTFAWFLADGQPTVGTNEGVVGAQSSVPEDVIFAFQFNILDPCFEDLSIDRIVDGADLGLLLGAWGTDQPRSDLNVDGTVNGADLGLLLGKWGPCPLIDLATLADTPTASNCLRRQPSKEVDS